MGPAQGARLVPLLFGTSTPRAVPAGRGSRGRWLLPFHVQGQSAHVRQDRGHPPKPVPGPRRGLREGALGAWDVGHEHPESPDSG